MRRILLTALLAAGMAASVPLAAGPLGILGGRKEKDKDEQQQVKSSFQNFHYDKKADWDKYKKIKVEPVDISALPGSAPWKAAAPAISEDALKKGSEELAEAMRKSFCSEISARASKSWTLVDSPDDETAVLHLYITRLVPPPPAGQSAAEAPSISFEGKLVDRKSGNTIMSFSETQSYTSTPGGSWYGSCPQVAAKWADDFAEMSMPDPKSEDDKDKSRLRKVARMVGIHFGIRKFMD